MGDSSPSEVSPEIVNAAVGEAQIIGKGGRSWVIPLATAVVLTALFCGYYFVYAAARREYLANRNFRALALFGDQLQTLISIHGSVLEFYSDLDSGGRNLNGHREMQDLSQFFHVRPEDMLLPREARAVESRKDYLKYLAPNFQLEEIPLATGVESVKRGSRLQMQRRNGQWEMVLAAVRHPANHKDYVGSLKLDDLLNPLVGSLPFDDILLVADGGRIVYQHQKTGPQFTTLTDLLRAQTGMPAAKPGEEAPSEKKGAGPGEHSGESNRAVRVEKNSDPEWAKNSMHLTDVMLAGTAYKLFLQPVVVDIYSDESSQDEPAREWVLCGLR